MTTTGGVDPRAGAAGLRRSSTSAPGDRRIAIPPPPTVADLRPVVKEAATEVELKQDTMGQATALPRRCGVATPEARDHATTVYLAGRLSEALRMERARTKRAQVDIILDAVSEQFSEVAARHGHAPGGEIDPILGIARRSRRQVEDGRVVQLRFSSSEKAALTRLATEATMTVSALVSECLAAQLGLSSGR